MSNNESARNRKPLPEELGLLFARQTTLGKRIQDGHADFWPFTRALQHLLNSRTLIPKSLTPPPVQQLALIRMLNKVCGWGIHDFSFDRPERNMPSEHFSEELKSTQAIVLDVHHNTFKKTITRLWSLIEAGQASVSCYQPKVTPDDILPLIDHWNVVPLEWRIVDFSANTKEKTVVQVREKSNEQFPTSAILWAMVYNPHLLQDLQKLGVDSVWMAGCRFEKEDPNVPYLNHEKQLNTLELHDGHAKHGNSKCTIPQFVTNRPRVG